MNKVINIFIKILILLNILLNYTYAGDTGIKFVAADYVEYNANDGLIYADGNIRILKDDNIINCNNAILDLKRDLVFSNGNIVLFDEKNNLSISDNLILKDKLNEGIINGLTIKFGENILLTSKSAERINKDIVTLEETNFTPCKILCKHGPFWQLSAGETKIDYKDHTIEYKNMIFKVYEVPVLYTPYFWHVLPNSPAKSGLLVPSLDKNQIKIPIYFRIKPNMDFTLSPRISKKAVILEFEARHKLKSGEYFINNDYGIVPYKNKKIQSNYFYARGNFKNYNYNYGFNINLVSDKAFLKNFYSRHDSYLKSEIYLNQVNDEDYYSIKSAHFRDLKEEKFKSRNSIILPLFETKKIFNLNDEQDTYFKFENFSLIYNEKNGANIFKNGLHFTFNKDFRSINGHLLGMVLGSREDIYFTNFNNNRNSKMLVRNIPQAEIKWSYPLINIMKNSTILIEPIVNLLVAPKFRYKKFLLNDPAFYELDEHNIFSSNKYSGLDYYDFGRRVSYGIHANVLSRKNNMINVFLGQLYNKDLNFYNIKTDNIGYIQFKKINDFDIYYKFRKGQNFSAIKDEIGFHLNANKITLDLNFIHLHKIKIPYVENTIIIPKKSAQQTNCNINYQLNENWSFDSGMRFELRHKKPSMVNQSLRVTYSNECVSISFKINEDYTADIQRGIKKTRDQSFHMNFKVLNM